MDNNSFQTSFIPKKPLVSGGDKPISIDRPMGALHFISILFIVGAIALYGGLFIYKNILLKKLNNLHVSLKTSQESFEKGTIEDLQLFDKRMSVSKRVISEHIIFSPLFDLINILTLPSVQFTKFDETNSVDNKSFLVKMSGVAQDYRSIALQAQVLNSDKGKYFKNVVFSNLTLADEKDKRGYVKFDVSFSVDPTLLSYEKFVLQSGDTKAITVPVINTEAPVSTPSVDPKQVEKLPVPTASPDINKSPDIKSPVEKTPSNKIKP